MAFSRFPFDPLAPLAILSGQYAVPPPCSAGAPPPPTYSTTVTSLLANCLTVDPDVRSTVFQILGRLPAEGVVLARAGVGVERGECVGGGSSLVPHEIQDWANFEDKTMM